MSLICLTTDGLPQLEFTHTCTSHVFNTAHRHRTDVWGLKPVKSESMQIENGGRREQQAGPAARSVHPESGRVAGRWEGRETG